MREKQLKPHQHYSDLYDKFTVSNCRDIEKIHRQTFHDFGLHKKDADKEQLRANVAVYNLHLYFEKGESYKKKKETIQKWMEEDIKHDEFLEKTKPPQDIPCLMCGRIMFNSFESYERGFEKRPDRVLYFYDCPLDHRPKRAFYDNGEEYISRRKVCPECRSETKDTHKRFKTKVVTTWKCLVCPYVDKYELDLRPAKKQKEVVDDKYVEDRDRFCLSEKEGEEYIASKHALVEVTKSLQAFEERKKDKEERKDVYEKVSSLKKLKLLEVEELLKPVLEKSKYVKFHTKEPEIGRDVFLPFAVYDTKQERNERASVFDLNKLLRKTLEDTNWRLMSDGTYYRLGMLEGRLRAYEKEEDLLKLFSDDKPSSKNKVVIGKDGEKITL